MHARLRRLWSRAALAAATALATVIGAGDLGRPRPMYGVRPVLRCDFDSDCEKRAGAGWGCRDSKCVRESPPDAGDNSGPE